MKRLLIPCLLILSVSFAVHVDASPAETAAESQQENIEETGTEAEKPQLKFDIWEFRITGNTVLEKTLVERAVYPYLGTGKSVEDVEAARITLQTLYKDNGYPTVLVDIPQQKVTEGIVKLVIIEGRVDRMKITGSTYFSLAMIREKVPALARGQVPHLPTVQTQLQALNTSNPDLRVTPIFRPGRLPGTVGVELRVKDDSPFHGSLEVNGRNSIGTTRTRLLANLSYGNLWLKDHNISLTYQMSPEDTDEVQVVVGTYTMPVGENKDRLAIYALKSDSETGVASSGALAVVGKGAILGARYVKPLASEQRFIHSIVLGADYKDFDEVVDLVGSNDVTTPISYTVLSIDYNLTAFSLSGTTSFSAGIKFAPRGLSNSEFEFGNKRFQATPNFSYFNALLTEEYRFENGFRLRGTVAGQIADQPLVSNEQYSVGGATSVRGYYESQVLADDAIRASFEVQSPDFESITNRGFSEAHLLAFIEGAATRVVEPLPDTDEREEISGAGFGMRLASKKDFNIAIDAAWALKSNKIIEKGDLRIHFQLRGAF